MGLSGGFVGQGGFSLLETMIVVAVLGVLAALAVPSVLPQVQRAQLDGTADAVAAFLARGRTEAMTSRRCVRFRLASERTAVLERLNAFDCDSFDATPPPAIDPSRGTWIEIAKLVVDRTNLALSFDPAPSELGPRAEGATAEIRFRPTGRIWSRDDMVADPLAVADDDGVVKVRDDAARAYRKVLVESQGLVCMLDRNADPAGVGNDLRCPQ